MTNKEFKALKDELRQKASLVVIQRRPYTTVVVEIVHDGRHYVDFGHSKVNWPDRFLRQRGKEIAFGRAIDEVANRIANGGDAAPVQWAFYYDLVVSGVPYEFQELRTLAVTSQETERSSR